MVIPGIRGMSLGAFFKKLYQEMNEDGVTDSAAQVSYYILFSLFPFLFFLATLAAFLPIQQAVEDYLHRLEFVMPPQAFSLIHRHVHELLHQPRPKLLTLGLVVSLYSASRGVDAFRKALNLAYDVTESRPYWRTQVEAVLMTIALGVLIVLAFTAIVLGGEACFWAFTKLGVGAQFTLVWSWLRFPFTALIVMFAAALSYYFLPDVKQQFKFITPGSLLGTLFWVAATWGFTFYSDHFGHYNVTYGSLGGVILLMIWFYISTLVFILGGEINAIIEHASEEGKSRGARVPGVPSPPPEALASHLPQGAAKRRKVAERQRWAFWRRAPE